MDNQEDNGASDDRALASEAPTGLQPPAFDPSRDDLDAAFQSGHEEGFIAGVAAVMNPRLHHRAIMGCVRLGKWMSAALDDPNVCDEMKSDIREWFSSGEPVPGWGAVLRDSDRSGEAVETTGSTVGESAGLQGIAPNNPKEPTP